MPPTRVEARHHLCYICTWHHVRVYKDALRSHGLKAEGLQHILAMSRRLCMVGINTRPIWTGNLGNKSTNSLAKMPLAIRCFRFCAAYSSSSHVLGRWRHKLHLWIEHTKPVAKDKLIEWNHKWNDYSGYAEINALKEQVQRQSDRLSELQHNKNVAKMVYLQAVSDRSASQRRINDLLSRKSSWKDDDLTEYTTLLHSEHNHVRAEERSQLEYERTESEMQRGFDDLMRSVMRRYHEEHLWSDRVRSISTYVSVGLGILNVMVFILALFFVEPFKRRRLAQTLETRLLTSEDAFRERMQTVLVSVDERLANMESMLSLPDAPQSSTAHSIPKLGTNFLWVSDIFSWLSICGTYVAKVWNQVNVFTAPQELARITATSTGVVIGGVFSYLLLLLII